MGQPSSVASAATTSSPHPRSSSSTSPCLRCSLRCLGSGGLGWASGQQPSLTAEGAAAFNGCLGGTLRDLTDRQSRNVVHKTGNVAAKNPGVVPRQQAKNNPRRPHLFPTHPGHPGPRKLLGINARGPAPGATDSTAGRAVTNVRMGKHHRSPRLFPAA